jgi:uncharacterized membrane protein HdeD (DUF308 family)
MNWAALIYLIIGIVLFIVGLVSLLSDSSRTIYIGALVVGPIMAVRGGYRLMNRE